jgi:hypothetical protein
MVRPGDTRGAIAGRFHLPGGRPAVYARNKAVIGLDPDL